MTVRVIDGSSSIAYSPPTQSGNANKFIMTDGTSTSWQYAGATLLGSASPAGSSVLFNNIDQSYRDLILVATNIKSQTSSDGFAVRINGISGANCYVNSVVSSAATATANASLPYYTIATQGALTTSVTTTVTFRNYSDSSIMPRQIEAVSGAWSAGSVGNRYSYFGQCIGKTANTYDDPGVVTKIELIPISGTFYSQGTVYLYGVK